ncbi:MAG: hypothetical protein CMJ70_04325 [Planctomycetaceae bacterium]|nr:hypothetical protein [Planctomycetaceae bacterium]
MYSARLSAVSTWLPRLSTSLGALTAVACLGLGSSLSAGDWPMWRYDAQRTAATDEQLPVRPHLRWTASLPAREPAWMDPLNRDLMTYDRLLEPIVLGNRMFLSLNDRDQVIALDIHTGERLWSVFAEAPVRLPPVAGNQRVYFCSDDGFLYCVAAADGALQWRFRAAPGAQHAIGNRRLVSAWPARGGPVLRDQTVYFGASIWPFMGTFLYAIDAQTGAVKWVNDRTGSQYLIQPHTAPSFAGVGPQGALVATADLLLVPGGRSVPAAFNRKDGTFRYFEINAAGKGTGGSFVAANNTHFFVHTRGKGTRACVLKTGATTTFLTGEAVLTEDRIYTAALQGTTSLIRAFDTAHQFLWQVVVDASGDLILAGDHLYAAGQKGLTAIRLPTATRPAEVTWRQETSEPAERLLAAAGTLFTVTASGKLHAYGAAPDGPPQRWPELPPTRSPESPSRVAASPHPLLEQGEAEGYALWFGAANHPALTQPELSSPFEQLAVIDNDPARVALLRSQLEAAGVYGHVTVHHANPDAFRAPSYVANMVFVGPALAAQADSHLLQELYRSVRPYGGILYLLSEGPAGDLATRAADANLEQADITMTPDGVVVRRTGALSQTADWTHQYGNIANTIKSDDARVKLPLGVLWFGGNRNDDTLPRHGHGPPEQVVNGRLFIQGMNSLSARDVYTGRVLWKRDFEDLGTFDVFYDSTYQDTPLDTSYNQVHIPGANGRGTNYVVTPERLYLALDNRCLVLDPATGATLNEIQLPADSPDENPQWGFLGVYQDVLLGGVGFARYRQRRQLVFDAEATPTGNAAGFGPQSLDRAASMALVAFDRFSGKLLWQVPAKHSFWHNGIVAGGGRIYCLDKNPALVEDALRRRGESAPETYRILSLDHRTGEIQWETTEQIFGSWLGYSETHDILFQGGAAASDRLRVEVGRGMAVYAAAKGTLKWHKPDLAYAGPCILHNDWIVTNVDSYSESAGAFHILTGVQRQVPHPLTGEPIPWKITRNYGCNNILASENLLTFRSGAAGFYDLTGDSGTGNFGGFRTGCTANSVIANGVLNAPDYTRTCSCGYQNQTSLALIHMPDVELWANHPLVTAASARKRIEHLGINFGAPGDRRDTQGQLWLEYPAVSGPSAELDITLTGEAEFYRHHSSKTLGQPYPWVVASGVSGVSEVRIGMRWGGPFKLSSGLPVADANDDAQETTEGTVVLGSQSLSLGDPTATELTGLRFRDIPLAADAVIREAYLQFTCDQVTTEPAELTIHTEKAGQSTPFRGTPRNLSERSVHDAQVAWQPQAWNTAAEAALPQRTPDLSAILRPVLQHPDWQPGNALTFLIRGTGNRRVSAFEAESGVGVQLVVTADRYTRRPLPAQPHRVRLFFADRQPPHSQQSIFDVYLQGQRVLQSVHLGAGRPANQPSEHTFAGIEIGETLTIRLQPQIGKPMLAGVEVIRTPRQPEPE